MDYEIIDNKIYKIVGRSNSIELTDTQKLAERDILLRRKAFIETQLKKIDNALELFPAPVVEEKVIEE